MKDEVISKHVRINSLCFLYVFFFLFKHDIAINFNMFGLLLRVPDEYRTPMT